MIWVAAMILRREGCQREDSFAKSSVLLAARGAGQCYRAGAPSPKWPKNSPGMPRRHTLRLDPAPLRDGPRRANEPATRQPRPKRNTKYRTADHPNSGEWVFRGYAGDSIPMYWAPQEN